MLDAACFVDIRRAQHALMLERRRPCHIVCQIYAYSLRFLGHNIPNSGVSTY